VIRWWSGVFSERRRQIDGNRMQRERRKFLPREWKSERGIRETLEVLPSQKY
jgi:hypothetical protein